MQKLRPSTRSVSRARHARAFGAPITPLKLPRDVRTLLVFGGSFDPPHFYHTVGPLSVVGRLFGPDAWILYVPAASSPLKEAGHRASDLHRLAMLKRALDVPARRSIWTDELDRAAWLRERGRKPVASFTVDTLRRLRQVVPSRVTLRLLIGSDQAADFHKWKDARKIIEIAEPVVMVREPIVMPCSLWSALGDHWTREEKVEWCKRLAPNYPLAPASTDLRAAIPGAPRNPNRWNGRKQLDGIITSVAKYIIDHNLYRFRPGPTLPVDDAEVRARDIDGDGEIGRRVLARVPAAMDQALLSVALAQVRKAKKPAERRKQSRPTRARRD